MVPGLGVVQGVNEGVGDLVPCLDERGKGVFDLIFAGATTLSDSAISGFQPVAEGLELGGGAVPGISWWICRRI